MLDVNMAKYDKVYENDQHFGAPYPELVLFFREFEPKGKVLDLGCGQGRDALALARLGYQVTGVDISAVGISKMLHQAMKENLQIEGIIADIYHFNIDSSYDIILFDSMFHFYKRDKERETSLLEKIMNQLKVGGLLCIIVSKSKTAESTLEDILTDSVITWNTLVDKYIDYPEMKSKFRIFVLKKISS
jgi:2-polyprenyl-3-methyl-5-hydroxy-6-metoxy-1,4-benzoquinol methylase